MNLLIMQKVKDKEKYVQQFDIILADYPTFHQIKVSPTEDIKKKLNKLITRFNNLRFKIHFNKLKGHLIRDA